MTSFIDKHEYFVTGRDAFLVALEHPEGPDAKAMLDALFNIVAIVVYYLPDDDDFEGKCGPTGSVFTMGETIAVPGKKYDIEQTKATITEADLEQLEAGWESVHGYKSHLPAESFETGQELLEELRDFVGEQKERQKRLSGR